MRAYIIQLVIKLFRKLESSVTGKISARQKEAVESAVAYLRESFHTHITLDELATRIFLSKDYLNRIFRETTGLPVHAFLQRLRLEEACRLLTTTDRTVVDIATACGFGDSKSFYSIFKRRMHTTPGEYRASHRATEES